jgi:hypothetical protein
VDSAIYIGSDDEPPAAPATSGNILLGDIGNMSTVFVEDSDVDQDMPHILPPFTVYTSDNDEPGPPGDVYFDDGPVDPLAGMVSGEVFVPSDEDDDPQGIISAGEVFVPSDEDDDPQGIISADIFVPSDDDQDRDDNMFLDFSETFIPESDDEEGVAAYYPTASAAAALPSRDITALVTDSRGSGPYTAAHFANFDDRWLDD